MASDEESEHDELEGDDLSLLLLMVAASSRSRDSGHIYKATDSVQGFVGDIGARNGLGYGQNCGEKWKRHRG